MCVLDFGVKLPFKEKRDEAQSHLSSFDQLQCAGLNLMTELYNEGFKGPVHSNDPDTQELFYLIQQKIVPIKTLRSPLAVA